LQSSCPNHNPNAAIGPRPLEIHLRLAQPVGPGQHGPTGSGASLGLVGALPHAQKQRTITDIRRRRCRRNRRHRPVRRRPWGHPGCCRRHRRVRHRPWGHPGCCRRHRRVRHHRWGHRERCRRHPWDRHHRCLEQWLARAPRWTKEWSLVLCYCLALYCRLPHTQPLGRARRHRREARQQFWLRISSDSPLSTRATFVRSTCRTPA
jgi:hypothetical protein